MSFTKEITIWCDHPDCNEWIFGGTRVTSSRKYVRRSGWVCIGGRDLCPKHAPKKERE